MKIVADHRERQTLDRRESPAAGHTAPPPSLLRRRKSRIPHGTFHRACYYERSPLLAGDERELRRH